MSDERRKQLEQLKPRNLERMVQAVFPKAAWLDGRQVARSVYRDLRERKIKNYETL